MSLIKKWLTLLIIFMVTSSLIFIFKKNDSFNYNNLIVEIDSSFLDKNFIEKFISDEIISDTVNINNLENKFTSISYVKDVAIYKDLIGNLNIEIEQYKPLARIVSGKNSGNYLNKNGYIFPVSSRFSERVILLHLDDIDLRENTIFFSKFRNDLLKMINYINDNEFLSKIISELEVNSNKNIVIHPQFSKQKIIFGYPDDLDEKFEKINLFYTKIVEAKGWNTYKTINVKFKDQIVCDKG